MPNELTKAEALTDTELEHLRTHMQRHPHLYDTEVHQLLATVDQRAAEVTPLRIENARLAAASARSSAEVTRLRDVIASDSAERDILRAGGQADER